MTTAVFDKALELVAPGAALATTGSSTGVLLYPRSLPTCSWVVYTSGAVATGTYTFALQISDVVGGSYTTIAQIVYPPTVAAARLSAPIGGKLAQFFDNDAKYMKVAWTIGGATPGIVLGSFLAKSSELPGYAVDVGDIWTLT